MNASVVAAFPFQPSLRRTPVRLADLREAVHEAQAACLTSKTQRECAIAWEKAEEITVALDRDLEERVFEARLGLEKRVHIAMVYKPPK